MKLHSLTLLLSSVLVFASCASKGLTSASPLTGVDGEWSVTTIEGSPVAAADGDTPFLGFDTAGGNLYGFTGCNRLTALLNKDKFRAGRLDLSQLGMTQMLCPHDVYEAPLVSALNRVALVELSADSTLCLKSASGKTLITLKKKK